MSTEKDGVDIRSLLQTIQKRGGYKPGNTAIGQFETIRTTAEWTGTVYPQQLVNLKRNTMLITDSNDVTLGVDTDNKTVQYTFERQSKLRTDAQIQDMMQKMVVVVMGQGWQVARTSGKLQ